MRRIVLMLCVLALTLLSSIGFAKNVTVTGTGLTESDARMDAMRVAVEQGSGVMIDSKTWVQNAEVVEDNIISKSKGFVTDYKILNKYQNESGWNVILNAEIADNVNSKLMNELSRLGIVEDALRNPRIAVVIPEKHINYRVPDPAAETAIIKKFIDSGFSNMVDISKKRFELSNPYNLTTEELQKIADSMKADILIVGEAFSEGAGDAGRYMPGNQVSGIRSCRARVEAKMFYSRTGEIIATDGTYGSGADISEAIAGKKALTKAGEALGDYFVDKLIAIGSGSNQQMDLVVLTSGFQEVGKINSALNAMANVKNVIMTDYSGGKASFKLKYPGSPQALYTALEQNVECTLELRSANYNGLIIAAY